MNKKFKIVLISNTYNFFNSFMLDHIWELSKKYDLFICCDNAKKLKDSVPKNVLLVNINFKRGLSLFHDIIASIYTLFCFLKIKPHISISFTPKIGLIASLASLVARTPIRIHWFTGQIWAISSGLTRKFYKSIDRFISFISHHILVDSFSQKNFLIKEKIISKNKSIVFHKGSVGGVNILKFKPNKKKRIELRKRYLIDKNTFVFLYLGRINKDKGIVELIDAFKKIKDNKNVLLIFVGHIEDKKLSHLFIKNKKILYFNFTTRPENWFSLADIICLPSHREGFGTVIIEAASCGIPALCSKIYGLSDTIIEYKTGFFHKVGNAEDIKKKMQYIISNKHLVKKYGKFARNRVIKDFEKSLITKKLIFFINSRISQNFKNKFK